MMQQRGAGILKTARATVLGALLALGPQVATADQLPVVVELFTSQGCASCPPADEWLGQISTRDDIIALALHVDYWDYLGWADPFADPRFTERQKSYARARGDRMIYTPQVIINGEARLEGSHRPLLEAHISQAFVTRAATTGGVRLRLERTGDTLWIRAEADPPLTAPVVVHLVRYRPQAEVMIERGENAGRKAMSHNIVTDWQALTEWPGLDPLQMDQTLTGDDPVVVILQEPGPGAVLAAARLR
jgi:hypothetical protein